MLRTFCVAALIFLLQGLLMTGAQAEEKNSFEIGFAPFLPVKTLIGNYEPLTRYLTGKLGMPAYILSAPDYRTFYLRIEKFQFPLIATPANSAYLAWADNGYIPLAQPVAYTRPVLLFPDRKTLKSLSELRGKKLALPDATSTIAMQVLQLMQAEGLTPGQDLEILYTKDHKSAINLMLNNEADACIVSDRAIKQLPETLQEKVFQAHAWDSAAMPGIVYLGNPQLKQAQLNQIRDALLEFANHTDEGKKLMKQFGYNGLKPVSGEDMEMLKPVGLMLRKELGNN